MWMGWSEPAALSAPPALQQGVSKAVSRGLSLWPNVFILHNSQQLPLKNCLLLCIPLKTWLSVLEVLEAKLYLKRDSRNSKTFYQRQ